MSRKDVSDVAVVLACRDVRAEYRDKLFARGVAAPDPSEVYADELLAKRTGQPRKVCERAIERACDRGLVDYGVSLRTAWPTPAGLALLGATP